MVVNVNTTHSSILATGAPVYVQLQREMHDALRAQHPEWIAPNGDCPTCDSYEARLAELLSISLATEHAHCRGNSGMPAAYAEARNMVFPEVASAIRKSAHEQFA